MRSGTSSLLQKIGMLKTAFLHDKKGLPIFKDTPLLCYTLV
ncbi:hypothetical protein ADIARSV_3565 [Arcticibacter svalbardensis MN12-7]|uniref:Uncharacterized protein n=1 Tax=Arcticibacter svalbardensis MN12-7 TaxID=1150600 RepID=R9GN56_9SPHI|nr:hypothetical protein ADIARSV_3565 [Arcticibacter svalbardensis MN12-7]